MANKQIAATIPEEKMEILEDIMMETGMKKSDFLRRGIDLAIEDNANAPARIMLLFELRTSIEENHKSGNMSEEAYNELSQYLDGIIGMK